MQTLPDSFTILRPFQFHDAVFANRINASMNYPIPKLHLTSMHIESIINAIET